MLSSVVSPRDLAMASAFVAQRYAIAICVARFKVILGEEKKIRELQTANVVRLRIRTLLRKRIGFLLRHLNPLSEMHFFFHIYVRTGIVLHSRSGNIPSRFRRPAHLAAAIAKAFPSNDSQLTAGRASSRDIADLASVAPRNIASRRALNLRRSGLKRGESHLSATTATAAISPSLIDSPPLGASRDNSCVTLRNHCLRPPLAIIGRLASPRRELVL